MPRQKNMHMCFLKPWKKIFPAGLFIISIWDGQGSTLKSCVCVWNWVCQRWLLLWICSAPILGAWCPLCTCTPGCSQTFPPWDCGWRQAPARALEMHGTAFRREVSARPPWPSSRLPSLGTQAMVRPGEMQSMRRGGETGGQIFPVLCLISSRLLASLLTLACFHYLTLLPYEKEKAYWTNIIKH